MKINLKKIKIKDLVQGFVDNDENGVFSYSGNLNIRPPYQREFVYKYEQANAVIHSIMNGFPLNVMYWSRSIDGKYEILDGQQRTMSICEFYNGDWAYDDKEHPKYFHNLTNDLKDKFLNYELTIYVCDGTDTEKLKWFEIINIAGEKLTKQELRNAIYSGNWTADAKKYFSKINGPGQGLSKNYVEADVSRQKLLEIVLNWISIRDNCSIEEYMNNHQQDNTAEDLKLYFNEVIDWIKKTFPVIRSSEMKKVDWGFLYHNFKCQQFDSKQLEEQISELMSDDEVQKKSGIYFYVLTKKEKYLNLRAFNNTQKRSAYERQNGLCNICKEYFNIEEMEADHIIPWSRGGKTSDSNLQILCQECNREKSNR